MNKNLLGKKLQKAREKFGLTQEAVEKALDLPQKAVSRIESGQRGVSTLELSRFADLFHKSIADFFFEENDDDLLVALFRLAPGLENHPKIHEEVAKTLQICREGVFLEQLLHLPLRQKGMSYNFPYPSHVGEAFRQAEHAAKEERRRLGIGTQPIYDIVDLLSSQGIWCAGAPLPPEMSGLFLHHPSIGIAILVNATHVRSRQRFSYAHEYAHALFDQDRRILVSEVENASELLETRANAFAAAFLMPCDGVAELIQSLGKCLSSRTPLAAFDVATQKVTETENRHFVSRITPPDVAFIAHHFRVSYQAMIYRLHTLGYLSSKERENLLQHESQGKDYLRLVDLDPEKAEDSSFQKRELKSYISRLIIEAYRSEKISRGRLTELCKLLGLSSQLLLSIAENK